MHAMQVVYICQHLLELSQWSAGLTPPASVMNLHGQTSDLFHTCCICTFSLLMKHTPEHLLTDNNKEYPLKKEPKKF